jgi:hypothetical protein
VARELLLGWTEKDESGAGEGEGEVRGMGDQGRLSRIRNVMNITASKQTTQVQSMMAIPYWSTFFPCSLQADPLIRISMMP